MGGIDLDVAFAILKRLLGAESRNQSLHLAGGYINKC